MPVYPGTFAHQSLLRAIVETYESDPRVRAVIVFGSLGRGDWDAWSDIDLDVVIEEGVEVDPVVELRRLCAAFEPLGERHAIVVRDGDDAGGVVLESLMQLSVRYHTLSQTSPAILSSMLLLAGNLDLARVAAAGEANRTSVVTSPDELLDACVRYAAVANVYLQRRMIWLPVEVLNRMRNLLLQLFALGNGYDRAFHAFETADARLQAHLGETLPDPTPASLLRSLETLVDILEIDLPSLTGGKMRLSEAQQVILANVRKSISSSIPAKHEPGLHTP